MYTYLTTAKVFDPAIADIDEPDATLASDRVSDDDRLSPVRGIVGAVLISVPFWVLVGFALYLLM
jgi:hypothetical protein